MKYKENLVGQKFNLLTVQSHSHTPKGRGSFWVCKCDCGNITTVRIDGLKSGHPKSCGCLSDKWAATGNANRLHGKTGSGVYRAWQSMKSRCLNKKNKDYRYYGGRGITVCKSWLKFENFIRDMGEPLKNFTIERKNNNKGYSPGNCTWLHKSEQNNNKRNSIILKYKGKKMSLKQWAEFFNINYSALHKRFRYSGKTHIDIFKGLDK